MKNLPMPAFTWDIVGVMVSRATSSPSFSRVRREPLLGGYREKPTRASSSAYSARRPQRSG